MTAALVRVGVPSLRDHQAQALQHYFSHSLGETVDQNAPPPSVIQFVRTGGGKTLVPMLFSLLRRDHQHLFDGNHLVVAFSPTVALLWDMERRFTSAGLRVWTPPRSDHEPQLDDDDDGLCNPSPCPHALHALRGADVMLVTVEFYSGSSPRAAAARHHVLQESLRDPSFLVWIDEADQIVNDAGDFRPSLQYLEGLTDRLPRSSFLLSSATWTTRMLRTGLSFYYPGAACCVHLQPQREVGRGRGWVRDGGVRVGWALRSGFGVCAFYCFFMACLQSRTGRLLVQGVFWSSTTPCRKTL